MGKGKLNTLTRRQKLVWEIFSQFLTSDIRYGPKQDDWSNETCVTQHDLFVSREFAYAITKYHVIPVFLQKTRIKMFISGFFYTKKLCFIIPCSMISIYDGCAFDV